MSRQGRKRSNSGYYHVMLRGNAKENIFHDEQDKLRFIEILKTKKQGERFYLHAFCLMDNHLHLMISEGIENLSKIMKRINVSYVFYFNQKYKRVGHLFQDRFKSENVEQEKYLLALVRYIHQNPLKAGLVKRISEYKWSSYNSYLYESNYFAKMLDKDIVLGFFSSDKPTAKRKFTKFMNEDEKEQFIDIEEVEIMEEEIAKELFESMLKEQGEAKSEAVDKVIKDFSDRTNLSIRKIATIAGISKDRVHRILKS